jgi:hypothetical protein
MTPKSWISWLGAGLIALALIVAPPASMVHAVGDAHKVSVVSFGLFGKACSEARQPAPHKW